MNKIRNTWQDLYKGIRSILSSLHTPRNSNTGTFEMTEDNANTQKTPKLRDWLPEKNIRESIFTGNFCLIFVVMLLTCIFISADFVMPTSEVSNGEPDATSMVRVFLRIGSTVTSIFLGFVLSNWWTEWKRGDRNRAEAIRIDNQVEQELHKISEHWKQTVHAIRTLRGKERTSGFTTAVKYQFGVHYIFMAGYIREMALEIDRLGYKSEMFLEEKMQRFSNMRKQILSLVGHMPQKLDIDELMYLLNEEAQPQLLESTEAVANPGNEPAKQEKTT